MYLYYFSKVPPLPNAAWLGAQHGAGQPCTVRAERPRDEPGALVGAHPPGEPPGQIDRRRLSHLRDPERVDDLRERPARARALDRAVQVLRALPGEALERGMVHRRADFFALTVEDLESLERFARKSACWSRSCSRWRFASPVSAS